MQLDPVVDQIPNVDIDVKRVREVTDNLITNAIKYSEKGGINLLVFLDEDKENVCVSITDTGMGILEDEINQLFSKFYRVQDQRKGRMSLVKPGGTGLDLFVAKNIIEKHNGKIWVDSEFGKGSTFTFTIPIGKE